MCIQCRCFGLLALLLLTPAYKFLECFEGYAGEMHLSKERDQIFLKHDHIVTVILLTNATLQMLVHFCDAQFNDI